MIKVVITRDGKKEYISPLISITIRNKLFIINNGRNDYYYPTKETVLTFEELKAGK